MQFDVQLAFPYPVLRPYVDDYLDGDFQAIADVTHPRGSDQIHLDAQFALSVDEIASLVRQAQAKFVLVVSCRDTLHQRGDQICYRLRLWKVSLWQLKGGGSHFPLRCRGSRHIWLLMSVDQY